MEKCRNALIGASTCKTGFTALNLDGRIRFNADPTCNGTMTTNERAMQTNERWCVWANVRCNAKEQTTKRLSMSEYFDAMQANVRWCNASKWTNEAFVNKRMFDVILLIKIFRYWKTWDDFKDGGTRTHGTRRIFLTPSINTLAMQMCLWKSKTNFWNMCNTRLTILDSPIKKTQIVFQDIFPIFQDPDTARALLELLTNRCKQYSKTAGKKIDVVVGLDSRGFLLGPAMAMALNCAFVPVRKSGKLPGTVLTVWVFVSSSCPSSFSGVTDKPVRIYTVLMVRNTGRIRSISKSGQFDQVKTWWFSMTCSRLGGVCWVQAN